MKFTIQSLGVMLAASSEMLRVQVDAFAPAPTSKTFLMPSSITNARSCEGARNFRIYMSDDASEASFKARTKQLCEERNLGLAKVKNARDLASVQNSPIKPGRVYRTGRLGDATKEDRELLFETIGIRTLVDLRSPTELKDDPKLMSEAFDGFTDLIWMENKRGQEDCLKELKQGESPIKKRFRRGNGKNSADDTVDVEDEVLCEFDCDDPTSLPASKQLALSSGRKERHFVSLMNEFKYVRGTVSKLRKRDLARSALKAPGAVLSKRIWNSLKKPFLKEINDGGLLMLNELLLRFGSPGIKYVLELCADKQHHPIAFYCTAGKDRTGMISAIILSICDVEADEIVEDYTLSANVYAEMNDHKAMVGALSQRSIDPKTFLSAPPEAMRDTLAAIKESYGSVEGYCDWIGFDADQREKLRRALLDD